MMGWCSSCTYRSLRYENSPCATCSEGLYGGKVSHFKSKEGGAEDMVQKPNHYWEYGIEVKEVLKFILTEEEFLGFCKGTELKYRLRAGLKGNPDKKYEDIDKAMKVRSWRIVGEDKDE